MGGVEGEHKYLEHISIWKILGQVTLQKCKEALSKGGPRSRSITVRGADPQTQL